MIKIKKICKKAFTLAEVLIVIGIIGVVSALTIPNLQEGTNSKEVVTKVTKARATIGEAYGRAIATYGDPCTWALNQSNQTAINALWFERVFENFKTDKTCGLVDDTNTTCWDSVDVTLNDIYYKAKMADGTSMAMLLYPGVITSGYSCRNDRVFTMVLDIDGPNKGRGKECEDIFSMSFYGNGSYYLPSASGNLQTSPGSCSYWILDKGNADFLKASTYSTYWKCPNGKILDWANNTTCN